MNDLETIRVAAQASLAAADATMKNKDWEAANRRLLEGLKTLGDRYVLPASIDETGMKLVAAEAEEKNGRLENAAQMRRRILQTRLDMLQQKASSPK